MPERLRGSPAAPALLLAALLAAGCTDAPPTEPNAPRRAVAGEWAYTAPEVRPAGSGGEAPCEITGLVLHIEQLRYKGAIVGTLEGRTSGGRLTCRGDLSVLSGPLASYKLGNAHTIKEFIAFDIGTPDWRHDAVLAGDSAMSGHFLLRNGALRLQGSFVARRTRR